METVATIGIRELKNKLSAYLQEVRRGLRILITDRHRVIAELREPQSPNLPATAQHPTLARWVREGALRLPTEAKSPRTGAPLHLPDGTARRLIAEDRGA